LSLPSTVASDGRRKKAVAASAPNVVLAKVTPKVGVGLGFMNNSNKFRLPKNVVPQRYEIKLVPDLDAFTFSGEETILITVHSPTRYIILNAIELVVKEPRLRDCEGKIHQPQLELKEEDEQLELKFAAPIDPGNYSLDLKLSGVLNDKLHGFYRSKYIDKSGEEKFIATTQFEATDARRAFPCWDEPEFKAVFSVSLEVDQKHMAISNAAVEREKMLRGTGKKLVKFKDTIKMSTYLVAFIVGPFVGSAPLVVNGIPIRILTLPEKRGLSKFAMGIAQHSLAYFEKYYGVKYPGDKLDLIAIPDFAFGAMENLGAITFRETALLVDEKRASHSECERVADVVAHEIAHMWFGDLTTMKWWNGIWLNEAFATFMEMMAVDTWKPEWKRWESFAVSRAQALATDGLESTRSIEFPVGRPEEANAMFDVLTYEKGASVLRMLEQYIGPGKFRKGVSAYLKKFQYANTDTADLWEALEGASKEKVGEIMQPWIFDRGYPVVKLKRLSGRNFKVSQRRFFYLKPKQDKSVFHIPLILKARVGSKVIEKKLLLDSPNAEIDFEGDVSWLLANAGGHGFYRVLYADIEELMKPKVISRLESIERFNLVNDSWALAMAGDLPLSQYLKLISLLEDERDKNVWTVVTGSLKYLFRLVEPQEIRYLESFTQSLLCPVLSEIGWPEGRGVDTESSALDQLRALLIETLGTFGNDENVRKRAIKYFEEYKSNKAKMNAELVPALINVVGFTGDASTFDSFVKEFKETNIPQEQDRYLYALANFQSQALLRRTLHMAIDGTVRNQNAPFLIRAVMLNPAGRQIAWQFVKDKWAKLQDIFPGQLVVRMLEGVTGLVSREWLLDCRKFFKDRQVPVGQKTLEQYLEKQAVALALKEREAHTFSQPWS